MSFWGKKKKRNVHVLIVEDDALLAQVLSEQFQGAGFRITVEANGAEAFNTIRRVKPDAIILDLILPGLDGFSVLRLLKADAQTKGIPVIVLSNLGAEADVRSARALGATDYFIKANTGVEAIIAAVKKILS